VPQELLGLNAVDTEIRQLNGAALDSRRSVVIEACAGSGKTWLLVSRIVRLLLAGARPSSILAITFTRKAAQEMQSRLHEWLHRLATDPEEEVAQFLREREVPEEEIPGALPKARALFEQFLSDQPGITVSTFHGWFMHLLKHAPLASGSGVGATLVERTSALLEEAWQLFAETLQRNPDSPVARALTYLFAQYGLESTRALLVAFVFRRAEWWAYTRGQPDPVVFALQELRAAMPVAPDTDVLAELFENHVSQEDLEEYAELLEKNGVGKDSECAEALRSAMAEPHLERRFRAILPALFTDKGTLRVRKASEAQERRLGVEGQHQLLELHERLGAEFLETRAWLTEQTIYRLNEAGLLCGTELLTRYQTIKRSRGLLDFTDVEWRAWLLLNDSEHAEYMQYKLDARYRHILLDEFQDTNPLQWQVMKAWLEASAQSVDSGEAPTVFLVGDPKQSIYRFRRAESRLFGIARDYLQERFDARALEQNITRRNAPQITTVVNRMFEHELENFHAHVSYHPALPGTVQILPLSTGHEEAAEPLRWRNPLAAPRVVQTDRRRETEAQQLAAKIGEIVGRWQVMHGGVLRPARYQDIMVLVTRRTHLEVYERAMRHAQIPYVSSRQGGLLDTLEADDLTSLLQFLVVPFADLHLACALRSPIFAASDDDLQSIALSEGVTWWQRLSHLVAVRHASPSLRRAHALLRGWLSAIDRLPVHDLLDRIYFEGDVTRRYEAAAPLSMRIAVAANLRAFMEVALAIDAGRYPSLQGFLHELANLRRAAAEEAPDEGILAEDTDAVRVLTVHGAKGLEAPIVWVLDANSVEKGPDSFSVLVDWPPEGERPVHFSLCSRSDERGTSRVALFEREEALAERENLNLLYVAVTRARQAVFVSGSDARSGDGTWYRRAAAALEASKVSASMLPLVASPPRPESGDASGPVDAVLVEALRHPVAAGKRVDTLVDPRRRHGTLVHTLLERLAPPEAVQDRDFLKRLLGVSDEEFDRLWLDARQIVTSRELERFFDPARYVRAFNELAYVSASGDLKRIDRVVELQDEIWVLDYKTGEIADPANLAAAAKPYRAQLAEYQLAVSGLLPGKPVVSALVFAGGLLHRNDR
jgi:ATP-dependent helicase/nuclease subunit A